MKTLIFLMLLISVTGEEEDLSYEELHEPNITSRDVNIVEKGFITNWTNISPRIVGGNPADPGMFPYQVAILIYLDKSPRYYFCGGVLMGPYSVLTAAHCCEAAQRFLIICGATNFRINEPTQTRINSTLKIIHPGWNNQTLQNDICVIMLPSRVKFTNSISPIKICNKTKNDALGCYSTISGWGRTSDNSPYINDVLRYVSVPVIPTCDLCQSVYLCVFNTNICTSSDSGMSPCNGDSGGPMTMTDDDGNDCLIGIVSYGHIKGCQCGFPSVQTFVRCYAKWINKVVNYYTPDTDYDSDCRGACM